MPVPFRQYLRPNGRQKMIYITRPDQVEAQARHCINKGYRFEIEVLGNGWISMTSMYKDEEKTVAIQIGPNDDKIPALVDSLVRLTFEESLELVE